MSYIEVGEGTGGLTTGAAAGAVNEEFQLAAGVALRDAVYVSGAGIVDKADASLPARTPAIGFVSALSGLVQTEGEMDGFAALSPNTRYYLSATTPGALATVAPSAIGQVVQSIGIGKTSTVLVIMPEEPRQL